MKSIFIFFNRHVVKSGVAIIFLLSIAFLISDFLTVTDNAIAVDALITIEDKINSKIGKKQHKTISPNTEYHEVSETIKISDENHLNIYLENEVCSDNLQPPHNNCTQTSGVEVVNAELKEINTLKELLYGQDKVKKKIEAVKKLGKYRSKASYDILLNTPFELNTEIRLEIIKQLRNLLPQLVKEYGDDIRYVFELAMSDIDKTIAAVASDALNEIDDLNKNIIEKNYINHKSNHNNNPP